MRHAPSAQTIYLRECWAGNTSSTGKTKGKSLDKFISKYCTVQIDYPGCGEVLGKGKPLKGCICDVDRAGSAGRGGSTAGTEAGRAARAARQPGRRGMQQAGAGRSRQEQAGEAIQVRRHVGSLHDSTEHLLLPLAVA